MKAYGLLNVRKAKTSMGWKGVVTHRNPFNGDYWFEPDDCNKMPFWILSNKIKFIA